MTVEEKATCGEEIRRGIEFCKDYLLMAMYNANDRTEEDKPDFLSKKQLADFYARALEEIDYFIKTAVEGEPGLDTFDQAMLHEGAKETIKKRLGF